MIGTEHPPYQPGRIATAEPPAPRRIDGPSFLAILPPLLGVCLLVAGLIWVMKLEATLPSIRIGDVQQVSVDGLRTLEPGTYLVGDSSIQLGGTWFDQTLGTSTPTIMSSSKVTTTPGSTISMRFYGTDLTMTARIGPESGKVYISVDGEDSSVLPVDEHGSYVDFYASQAQEDTILIAHGLAHRDHTLQIVTDGTAEVAISGFSVSANTPFPWAFIFLYVALTAGVFVLIRLTAVKFLRRLEWIA